MDLAHPTLTLREGGRLQQPAQQNAGVLGKVSAPAQPGVWDPEGVNYHLLPLSIATRALSNPCSVTPEGKWSWRSNWNSSCEEVS